MRIAIIGGGMAGLGAAYELAKTKHRITLFERSAVVGGLASSVMVSGEPLEPFYHHMFPTYHDFFEIAGEIGIREKMFFRRAKTGVLHGSRLLAFSGPLDLLLFTPLSLFERIKTGLWVAYLKFTRDWRQFENISAVEWLRTHFGEHVWAVLWRPLLEAKFGRELERVSMAWFWSRIYERPSTFGYFRGGFKTLNDALELHLQREGVEILLNTPVEKIEKDGNLFFVSSGGARREFDQVIVASPPSPFLKIAGPLLPDGFAKQLENLKYMGSICVVLVLSKRLNPFYWLNVNDPGYPFLAVVEQTNFIDPSVYGGNHVVYLSKYLDPGGPFYRLSEKEIWEQALPLLKAVNPDFSENWIKEKYIFRAPFTQPVITVSYQTIRPKYQTPVPCLWWVSMSHIYPWDRGTDHSFHAGRELARSLLQTTQK